MKFSLPSMISEDILKVTTFLTQKIGERSQIKVYFFVRRPNSQLTACRYRDILRILYIRIEELSPRYKHSQIKAATHVNSEMLQFYWSLGKDIVALHAESRWGEKFLVNLSSDLRVKLPGVKGLSETSIEYAKRFYLLYNIISILQFTLNLGVNYRIALFQNMNCPSSIRQTLRVHCQASKR